ncbi:hypothetical protein [Pinirhizobacter soli]|uniref:hypothetical protein n=1 Tax=Pinirhizobacter soli TaxID=2786953 RepID=UPI00202A2D7E|nr:hypothetical protein [Pinirhizobacter soli]
MNRHIVAAMLAVVCTACVPPTIKTSAVAPVGDGTYLVVSKPSYNTNWNDIRFQTLQVARDYCAGQDQKMLAINTRTHGTTRVGDQDLELRFRCAP